MAEPVSLLRPQAVSASAAAIRPAARTVRFRNIDVPFQDIVLPCGNRLPGRLNLSLRWLPVEPTDLSA